KCDIGTIESRARAIVRKFISADDRTDLPQEISLGVAQLINHHGESEEGCLAMFDQPLRGYGLTALLGPVIDQEDAIVGLQGALLDLQLLNHPPVVGSRLL